MFTDENTSGYSHKRLDALNAELRTGMRITDAVKQAVAAESGDFWKTYLDLKSAQRKAHFLNSQSDEDREYAAMKNASRQRVGRRKMAFMQEHIEAGRTVYIRSMTHVIKIGRKQLSLLKMGKSGSVYVRRGKRWDCIDWCGISAK